MKKGGDRKAQGAAAGERILVVGPAWVGDMVMAQSLFIALKRRDPDCEIDVLGPAWSTPLITRMPEVRSALVLEVGHGETGMRRRWRLGRRLKGHYDRAIVLPRSMKSALVPFFARIPKRVGFTGEQRYGVLTERRRLDKAVLDQTVKRFVSLGLPLEGTSDAVPHPKLRVDPARQQKLRSQYGLDAPLIALMPGAEYGPAKQWPLSHFREVAQAASERGFRVLVLGGPKDAPAGCEIGEGLPAVINLCGKTSLTDALDLLGLCQQAISNDSGLMHVAAAVGTHLQAIYGSSSPRYTPPLTEAADIHWLDLACSPCFERTCPLGHTRCLKEIAPERVLARLKPH